MSIKQVYKMEKLVTLYGLAVYMNSNQANKIINIQKNNHNDEYFFSVLKKKSICHLIIILVKVTVDIINIFTFLKSFFF